MKKCAIRALALIVLIGCYCGTIYLVAEWDTLVFLTNILFWYPMVFIVYILCDSIVEESRKKHRL